MTNHVNYLHCFLPPYIIEKIIERSVEEPIIILQSDHGPASILGHPYKWPRPVPEDGITERMAILEAYYLPGLNDEVELPQTPVNIFRFIFNRYFGENYAMLPDKSYFTDYKNIYEFREVTGL